MLLVVVQYDCIVVLHSSNWSYLIKCVLLGFIALFMRGIT